MKISNPNANLFTLKSDEKVIEMCHLNLFASSWLLVLARDWMFMSPQNLYVEMLTPSVMLPEGEALGRWLGRESGVPENGISALMKETPECSYEDTGCLWTKKWFSPDAECTRPFILDFPASRSEIYFGCLWAT